MGYKTVTIKTDIGERKYAVNSNGDGLFYWNKTEANWTQSQGTAQFSAKTPEDLAKKLGHGKKEIVATSGW
jgi:hypothetical protein